jgi:hypothetical protein
MNDRCMLGLIQPMKVRHCRIERKQRVERQSGSLAVEHKRPVAPQAHPIGVSNRSHHGEPVEGTAQHDDQNAGIAAFGARQFGRVGPGKKRAGAEQHVAPGRQMQG